MPSIPRQSDLTYSAPVLSVDLAAFERDGTPFDIWPCDECLPWHVEVIQDEHATGGVIAREWHAAECPNLLHLLQDEEPDD